MTAAKIILSLVCLWFSPLEKLHPVKISTGEMIYYKEKKAFTIKLRFFGDDFTAAVNQKMHTKTDAEKLDNTAGLIFARFIQPYFSLKINNKQVSPIYQKVSREDLVIILEYTLPAAGLSHINDVEIYYPILMDFFKGQQNVFRIDLLNDGNMTTFRFYDDEHTVKKVLNQKIF